MHTPVWLGRIGQYAVAVLASWHYLTGGALLAWVGFSVLQRPRRLADSPQFRTATNVALVAMLIVAPFRAWWLAKDAASHLERRAERAEAQVDSLHAVIPEIQRRAFFRAVGVDATKRRAERDQISILLAQGDSIATLADQGWGSQYVASAAAIWRTKVVRVLRDGALGPAAAREFSYALEYPYTSVERLSSSQLSENIRAQLRRLVKFMDQLIGGPVP